MSSGHPHDPLQDYFDSLLSDALPSGASRVSDETLQKDEGALKLAAGDNVASLPSSARAARAAPVRPYAEPVRTLNLRMPLPTLAPAPVAESAPVVTKQRVESEPPLETKQIAPAVLVETKPVIDAKTRIDTEALDAAPTKKPQPSEPVVSPPAAPSIEAEAHAGFAVMASPAPWLPNGRPQWAQQPFECLIFKAGGLQLAAPLVELGSIYPMARDSLTEIFGQTHWFMGLLPVKEYNIRTMDTALVVMPERYNASMRESYGYVVSLFGSDWGLAVDAVIGTVILDPERIRWRGERIKRPWLAGTLVDQMCALFDIAQLAWLFHNQDRKRVSR